jgi:hypothetical protein
MPQTATVSSEPRGEDDGGTEEQKKIGSEVFDTDEITPENAWAIGLLSKSHLNPLMEALDPDGSGHVTIKEINDFTSSRPREWRYIHFFLFVSHALICFLSAVSHSGLHTGLSVCRIFESSQSTLQP